MIILGVDPSLTSTGWCVMDTETRMILDCGAIAVNSKRADKRDKAINTTRTLLRRLAVLDVTIDYIVCEVPIDYGAAAKGSANNLMPLWLIVGGIIGKYPDIPTYLYFPREWKGTVPKKIHNKRTAKRLTEECNNKIEQSCKKSSWNDVYDAAGLCLFQIGELDE